MRSLSIALSCALTAPLAAQMVWSVRSPAARPAARAGHAMCYDAARQRTVLFGGSAMSSGGQRVYFGDTWEWDGADWHRRAPATSPSPRMDHAMAFDAARGRVVLFGGSDLNRSFTDTWEWDGTDWTDRSPASGPAAVGPMAWIGARQRVVMVLDRMWEWNGRTWTQLAGTTPGRGPVAYDEARQRLVMPLLGIPAVVWEWDGTAWTLRSPPTALNVLGHASATYDAARWRVVVVITDHGNDLFGETWEWDGDDWSPGGGPGVSAVGNALAYDRSRRRVVLFGGVACIGGMGCWWLDDTLEYHPTVRGATAPIGFGCAGSAGTPTLEAVGPPIVGNQRFALAVGPVPSNSSVFVGLGVELIATRIPPCTLYTPFLDVLSVTASAGSAEIPLPIPWITSLSGADLFVQGGALDPGGALLGLASLTRGMQVRIGD